MSIEAELRRILTESIKARNLRTANVVRMINSKVTERRTAKGFSGEVDDALYLDVIAAYKKSLEKARVEFQAAGERGKEQIEQLDFEIDFCAQFLPRPIGEDELRAAVKEAIAELGVSDRKMAGRVVGSVMKKHKGRADAALVKQIVDEEL